MSNGEQPAVIVERDHRTEIGAFLLGALVGAGIALLFAPGSGEETQARLRTQARRLRELTGERVRGLREDLSARVDSAKGVIGQGRQLAAEAREELEDKLARSKAAYRAGLDAAREEFDAEAEEHG
ncbi:MAG: YtxH domain-containing protein [Gemmatimonadetes bacterium]|nr:YtxH domain-containing protein [Gemmatimonadota bacterium]MXX72278.1 YtxH domain-containing protein [Gemmatimonadota bacterium]MYC91721.1 YtxH domain-containing protein [Gemmatimonadota bacterium]MYG35974.1 YtxH domain-containing protein [Gemmatimonadota bacterium]